MKKILPIFLLLAIFGCSSDDDDSLECINKIWGMTANCPELGECTYLATYGETQAGAGTVQVDESTYTYYTELGNTENGSLCWDGTK